MASLLQVRGNGFITPGEWRGMASLLQVRGNGFITPGEGNGFITPGEGEWLHYSR